MDLRQLKYFLTVVEECGFINASIKLNVAQPSISRSVKMLEEELQVALLFRTSREVSLTYAGEELARRAKLILNEVERTKSEILAIGAGKKGRLIFGTAISASIPSIIKCVAKTAEKYPNLDINICEDVVENLWGGLFDGSIDMAVTTLFSAEEKGLASIALYDVHVLAVSHISHPIANHGGSLENLADYKWAVLDAEGIPKNISTYFNRAGISPPEHPVRVSTRSALITLLKTGKYLAIVPDVWVREELKKGEIIPLSKPFFDLTVRVGLVYRKDFVMNEPAKDLIETICSLKEIDFQ
ncbi:MAG: LysR family transcriptional regulator [Rhodospirillaceae bacterium]